MQQEFPILSQLQQCQCIRSNIACLFSSQLAYPSLHTTSHLCNAQTTPTTTRIINLFIFRLSTLKPCHALQFFFIIHMKDVILQANCSNCKQTKIQARFPYTLISNNQMNSNKEKNFL